MPDRSTGIRGLAWLKEDPPSDKEGHEPGDPRNASPVWLCVTTFKANSGGETPSAKSG